MDFTISGITDRISKRLGDTSGDHYTDRAKEYFYEAMSMLIAKGDYEVYDIPTLMKSETITISAETGEIALDSIFSDDIFPSRVVSISSIGNKFYEIPMLEFSNQRSKGAISPVMDDVYYSIFNGNINFTPELRDDVTIYAILNPDDSIFIDGTTEYDLVSELGFGIDFVLRCISLAYQELSNTEIVRE